MRRNTHYDGNPVGVVADKLRNEKKILAKKIKSYEKKLSNLVSSIEYLKNDDVGNFIAQVKKKINESEIKLNDLRFKLNYVENQLNTLPTYIEIENSRKRIHKELARRTNESYLTSGVAFESLPFSEKKKIVLLFFGGQDENGKKFGIYIKPLEGKPKRYLFTAYGKIGTVKGFLEKRFTEYCSFPKASKYDDEVPENAAEIILDGNPSLKNIKEDMHSECHAYHSIRLYQR